MHDSRDVRCTIDCVLVERKMMKDVMDVGTNSAERDRVWHIQHIKRGVWCTAAQSLKTWKFRGLAHLL